VFETSGNGRIVRIPLQAFPNFWVFVYVVQLDGCNILIDTGSGTDASHEDLLHGLAQAGLLPTGISHILLTHAHIDHYGGLSKLKPLTSAKIACHELDVQAVAHHEASLALRSRRLASFLIDAGLADDDVGSLLGIFRFTKGLAQSIAVDFTYDTLRDHVPAMDAIHLPGHCPGHVALRLGDVIFCGDMVVEGVTPHLVPAAIQPNSGLDQYLGSIQRFQQWAQGAHLILNGHDEAITDLPAQIDATRENILRRMSRAISVIGEPLTIAEVCKHVYDNPNGYNLLLTIEKTGAYIEYMYEHAMIEIANPDEVEKGLPAKYRRLREIADEKILRIKNASMVE
jgi:glyoxylase-like metal-dependent hydrolase (beta-lactamase superfamily II)